MKKLLFPLVLLLFLISCRYEDGPLISMRSVNSRLEGNWQVHQYFVDGTDSSKLYKDSCNCTFNFHREGSVDLYLELIRSIGSSIVSNQYFDVPYKITDNGKSIEANTFYVKKCVGPFGINVIQKWKILKLKKDEFWFETILSNKKYQFKLKK